jgi:hypothetical protein
MTTPREALIRAITNYCVHTGKPIDGDVGCGDCAEIVDDCLTALAPWVMEWRLIAEHDGTNKHVLGIDASGLICETWFFKASSRTQDWLKVHNNKAWKPTHFMPLPKPPQVTP